jgi:uncharacterized protein (TIGR01777 family)
MRILIAGSSGLIGSALTEYLKETGHEVLRLVRHKNVLKADEVFWDPSRSFIDLSKLSKLDAVVNLCGKNIGEHLWTEKNKNAFYRSRIESTKLIANEISKLKSKPEVFLSASAIGYYGHLNGEIKTEVSSQGQEGFLPPLCKDWEDATLPAKLAHIRVVNSRTGVVFTKEGGALKKMLLPFKLGLGGKIGSGQQYLSWISLTDQVRALAFCLENQQISGPVNLVAPDAITNLELTKLLAKKLKRPAFLPLPRAPLKFVLKDMAEEIFLGSTRVYPEKLIAEGFDFKHQNLKHFLDEEL